MILLKLIALSSLLVSSVSADAVQTTPGCYKDHDQTNIIAGCKCFKTCKTCGYGPDPHEDHNCLSCLDDHHEKEEKGHGKEEKDGHDDQGHDEKKELHIFPVPYCFFVVGFLFMLTLDQVIFKNSDPSHDEKPAKAKNVSQDNTQQVDEKSSNLQQYENEGGDSIEMINKTKKNQIENEEEGGGNDDESPQLHNKNFNPSSKAIEKDGQGGQDVPDEDSTKFQSNPSKTTTDKQQIDPLVEEEAGQRTNTQALMSFGIAIIVHSCIDGLAIGIFSDVEQLAILAIGVIIHKIPVSCAVGSTFKSNGQSPKKWTTLLTFILFILASPIGMSIGMALGKTNHDTPFLSILQALSGGTFVYLSCCDLLIHEFHNAHEDHDEEDTQPKSKEEEAAENKAQLCFRVLKLFTFICGGSLVVALIALAPKHSH